MSKMKAQNFFAALGLVMIVSACGKSMNLQVSGQTANASGTQATNTIDTAKLSQSNTCKPPASGSVSNETVGPKRLSPSDSLEEYSVYDKKELKDKMPAGAVYQRAILQVAPKEAIKQVTQMSLILMKPLLGESKKMTICLENECHTTDFSSNATPAQASDTAPVTMDLRDLFDLRSKTDVELTDWIYANTTEYARPGYRKFRFKIEGMTFESAELFIQVITNDQLPKDFAMTPTCYVNGDDDQNEEVSENASADAQTPPVAPSEAPATPSTDVVDANTCQTGEVFLNGVCSPSASN